MSTLCRAGRERRKYEGATALGSPFFCRIHFSAFQKCRIKGGRKISEIFRKNSPFSKIFRIYFLETSASGQAQSNRARRAEAAAAKAGPSQSKWVKPALGVKLPVKSSATSLQSMTCEISGAPRGQTRSKWVKPISSEHTL
jgi:hypothetical protein